MRNTGLRRPVLGASVAGAVCVASLVSIAAGIFIMQVEGRETTASGLLIGLGIAPAVIGAGMFFLFLRGVRTMRDVRAGKGEIARWTVAADDVDAFRASDARRNALGPEYRNGYTPPDPAPPEGVEVVFVADGVMVGGTYFGLVTTGMSTFFGPQMLPGSPLSLEFGTVLVWASKATTIHIHRDVAALRIPVGRTAAEDAKRVLTHFQRVERREIVVNPGFYRGRLRFGLWSAAVCAGVAAGGFGLNAIGAELGYIPLVMAVAGTVAGIGGLVLAGLAWGLSARQRGRF